MNPQPDNPYEALSRFIGHELPEVSGHALEAELEPAERTLLDRVAGLTASDRERDQATRLLAHNATALDYLASKLGGLG